MADMHVAAVRIDLRIPNVRSLKGKRRILKAVTAQLARSEAIAVAEVDHHDLWQRAALGVALVAPQAGRLDRMLHGIERDLRRRDDVELLAVAVTYLEEPT